MFENVDGRRTDAGVTGILIGLSVKALAGPCRTEPTIVTKLVSGELRFSAGLPTASFAGSIWQCNYDYMNALK